MIEHTCSGECNNVTNGNIKFVQLYLKYVFFDIFMHIFYIAIVNFFFPNVILISELLFELFQCVTSLVHCVYVVTI